MKLLITRFDNYKVPILGHKNHVQQHSKTAFIRMLLYFEKSKIASKRAEVGVQVSKHII